MWRHMSTGCIKIKHPNMKTSISQKCVNIKFFSFVQHITVHKCDVSCYIFSMFAKMTETYNLKNEFCLY